MTARGLPVRRDNLALCKRAYKEHLLVKRALFNGDAVLLRKALRGHVRGVAKAVIAFKGVPESVCLVD